jgi:type I restriction enzyme S subunit
LKNKTEAKAIFLSTFLNSVYGQNQILRLNAGSNREGLNYNQVKEIMLPFLKDENEFSKIAKIIKKKGLLLQGYIKVQSKLYSLKTALMQDLLSGRVRVPSDMIKRIGEAGGVKTA